MLLAATSQALDRIASMVERISVAAGARTVTVSTGPTFATKWLLPRLGRLCRLHPEADLRVDVTNRLIDRELFKQPGGFLGPEVGGERTPPLAPLDTVARPPLQALNTKRVPVNVRSSLDGISALAIS
jgi:LysR family glycine cleavage system transcriptional activator